MNKKYEENRPDFFTDPGEKNRKQYVWAKNEKGEEYLQETEPIDIQEEIESYSDECDIKNIVRKASFDPEFLKTLQDTAAAEVDISQWPTNIHEYHRMIATAQINAMKLEELSKMTKNNDETQPDQSDKENKMHKKEMTKLESE